MRCFQVFVFARNLAENRCWQGKVAVVIGFDALFHRGLVARVLTLACQASYNKPSKLHDSWLLTRLGFGNNNTDSGSNTLGKPRPTCTVTRAWPVMSQSAGQPPKDGPRHASACVFRCVTATGWPQSSQGRVSVRNNGVTHRSTTRYESAAHRWLSRRSVIAQCRTADKRPPVSPTRQCRSGTDDA